MPKVFLIKRNLNKVIEDSAVSGYEQFKTKISVPQERDKKNARWLQSEQKTLIWDVSERLALEKVLAAI